MNLKKRLACAVLWIPCALTWAQDANPWNGHWSAHVAPTGKRAYDAKVTLDGATGVWKAQGTDHNDPCAGHESPITVKTATADDLVFRVMMSQSMAGCPDTTVTLKKVDENQLSGTRYNAPMTLTREK